MKEGKKALDEIFFLFLNIRLGGAPRYVGEFVFNALAVIINLMKAKYTFIYHQSTRHYISYIQYL